MKRAKTPLWFKLLVCILSILLVLSIIGCVYIVSHVSLFIDDVHETMQNSPDAICIGYSEDIIEGIDKKDPNKIKNMFSQYKQENYDLNSDINAVFDIFKEPFVSHDPCLVGMDREIGDGTIVFLYIDGQINNVVMEDGRVYSVTFGGRLNCKDPSMNGLSYIRFYEYKENGILGKKICSIGD